MNTTTVAIDLAKSVFQLAIVESLGGKPKLLRLTRSQFLNWFDNRVLSLVIMEACGTAHHWARWLQSRGIEVLLLPPHQVRPFVLRNKTDATDALALLEAHRCAQIVPVPVKSIEQQALQLLHRSRAQWQKSRNRLINSLRGACRELGFLIPEGVLQGVREVARVLADESNDMPAALRRALGWQLEDLRRFDAHLQNLDRELAQIANVSLETELLQSVPGLGLITSTAIAAKTAGSVAGFRSGRHFASWFGLAPKEYSSGSSRHLGRISKRGDRYIRMLLTHGARSLLLAATIAERKGKPLDPLRAWALAIQARTHRNKAVCALANKLARICYAVLRDHVPYLGLQSKRRRLAGINQTAAATA